MAFVSSRKFILKQAFSLNNNRFASKIPVILICDVDNRGMKNDVIKVSPGFARNYLIPRQQAIYATNENLKLRGIQYHNKVEESKKSSYSETEKKPEKPSRIEKIQMSRHVKDDGKQLIRPVDAIQVCQHMRYMYRIPVRFVDLAYPLRELGTYKIKYGLNNTVDLEIVEETRF